MRIRRAILHLTIAALLISGAAICALGQSGVGGKQNARERNPATQNQSKQETKQQQTPTTPAASKQNERESVAPPTVLAMTTAPADKIRYSYEFNQPKFFVRRILIHHDETGHGEISFERKDDNVAIVDPIELSEATLARVKALWDGLRFLDSQTTYQSERQFPHLGTMKLGMTRGERERVAEFNWTQEKDASALVNEYRRIADQAIFIFNITLARQNQPLEAPKLLDELERLHKRNGLSDAQQLIPLLRELANDERIPLIARNHASRLLKQIQK